MTCKKFRKPKYKIGDIVVADILEGNRRSTIYQLKILEAMYWHMPKKLKKNERWQYILERVTYPETIKYQLNEDDIAYKLD